MHIINQAVRQAEEMVEGCGYEHNAVSLTPIHDPDICLYEEGTLMRASFGGVEADYVTDAPINATTKLSFMFSAPLTKLPQQSAAVAIINALAGFLCMSRKRHACAPQHHDTCIRELQQKIGNKILYCAGTMPHIRHVLNNQITQDITAADLILISGNGLLGEDGERVGDAFSAATKKEFLFIGPSSSGVSSTLHCEHFCPYGR